MRSVTLGNEDILLDEDILKFSEATINQFLQLYASKYNWYMQKHSDAQYAHSKYEDQYDALKAEKIAHYKDFKASDKLAESKATADKEVQEALDKVRLAKQTVNLLWGYLRSMDRAHEDAMQLCYNMRKEMDKLFSTVKA